MTRKGASAFNKLRVKGNENELVEAAHSNKDFAVKAGNAEVR